MDRRTLLAILLAVGALLIYQVLFAPRPPQRQQPTAGVSPADSLGAVSQRSELRPRPPTEIEERDRSTRLEGFSNQLVDDADLVTDLAVDSDLYRAVLDPRGARFTQWTLAEYTDWREFPVDLVGNEDHGLFRVSLERPGGAIDFTDTVFALEQGLGGDTPAYSLRAQHPDGWEATIRLEFPKEEYQCGLDLSVEGFPNPKGDATLVLSFPHGLPRYERTAKQDEQNRASVAMIGKRVLKHRQKGKKPGWEEYEQGVVRWVGVRSKYFLAALIPEGNVSGSVEMRRAPHLSDVSTSLRLPLQLDGSTSYRFQLYGGPLDYALLESYGVELEKTVDMGWKLIQPVSRLLLGFMNLLHEVIPNYGVVILVISILTKVIFYPLTKKSMESMKGIQLLKPEIDKLNEKYKDDPQRKNQAMMELYKEHKINPLGGCLPILIQMPVFIALYSVLSSAIELRKEPFGLWINDLSAPDKVGALFGFPIHIMPVLMALTMFIQQKLTPTDPRQAMIGYIMPIMLLVFFYTLPSGLVVYWTVNNILQVGQQLMMKRETKPQLAAA